MIPWWAGRSRREQILLAAVAALALMLVAWFGILQPLGKARRAAAERLSEAAATQAAVQRGLAELTALRRAAPDQPDRRPMARAVTETAAAAGIALTRAEPDPGGGLRVGIEAVAPGVLFPWLAALQRDDGVAASHLTVVKADGGGLNVDATLVEIGR